MAKKPAAAKAIKKPTGVAKRSASRKARAPAAKLSTRRPASSAHRVPQAASDTTLLGMLAQIFGMSREAPRKNAR
jgi:hypothetical protein